jgi:CheY-like chemotaxis protein
VGKASRRARVLCVDDDRDIAEIVQAVLSDEGYEVSCLYASSPDILARTVGMLEPDCVLLDGGSSEDYGKGWEEAAALGVRRRPVPVVMFTAHHREAPEAREDTTERARGAGFAEIVEKPFDLDALLAAVARAVGKSVPFRRGPTAEARRTNALVKALEQAGATEVRPSTLREWATFRDASGCLVQLYWWQARGVYQVARYTDEGEMRMIGQLVDRDAAIALAMGTAPQT